MDRKIHNVINFLAEKSQNKLNFPESLSLAGNISKRSTIFPYIYMRLLISQIDKVLPLNLKSILNHGQAIIDPVSFLYINHLQ
jgi:hypothetical protein